MMGLRLKQSFAVVTSAMIVSGFSVAAAGTLFTNPIIVVSPRTINFGGVHWKTVVTNSFLVENWGGGKLIGKATVEPPFKILSGGSYKLGPRDVQVVTISYSPSRAAADTNVVKFTGGDGVSAPVTGKLTGAPADK